mmetsp:Transcript_63157/g.175113  ORF Transcript_63157/g.175113 Transcript_63157/m.175113 type:complete len:680 (+) Transcript_63157:97-2136(+)
MVAAVGSMSTEGPGGTADMPAKEVEVVLADMETRLRGTILRIIRPALDQVTDLNLRYDALAKQVQRHEDIMYMAEKLREEVGKQAEFIKLLSDQMSARDKQQRDFERTSSEAIAELRVGAAELSQRIEDQQGELRKQSRDLSRAWEETARLQTQHEETTKKLWEGIALNNKKAERIREELMEVVRELQRQREDLLEDLYGEDKGLTKLTRDLAALTRFCEPLPEVQRAVVDVRERQALLEAQGAELRDVVRKHQEQFKEFADQAVRQMLQVREDFQKEANRLIARNTIVIQEIRGEYSEEIGLIKQMHREMINWKLHIEQLCNENSERVQQEARRIDALHREIVTDIEEVQKKRKKDRVAWETEIGEVRQAFDRELDASQTVRVNLEFISRILGLVLEGQRVSSALHIQDFADRGAEKWLSFATEVGRRPQQPQNAEDLEQQRPRRFDGKDAFGRASHELVTVDFRKGLASGEYLPGRVPFGGNSYERRDLLLVHHKLLHRAHAAYVRGPFDEEPAAAAANAPVSVSGQPGANGGAATGQAFPNARSPPKTASRHSGQGRDGEDSEDPRLGTTAPSPKRSGETTRGSSAPSGGYAGGSINSSRQRPGSQGQPQAMGSPLGEASLSPEPASSAPVQPAASIAAGSGGSAAGAVVRLPSIIGDSTGSAAESSSARRSLTAR